MEIVGAVAGTEREIARKMICRNRDRVAASLRLDFERHPPIGRTILAASHQEPPLKVVRALAVHVGAHAQAQVTTTGATRIYRPRVEASATSQLNEITVGENGVLEYLPDAVIPFAGARFSQRTSIQLAEGAGLFWWEILAPGREARGEIFEYESVELKTNLVAKGRLVAAECSRLEPRKRGLAAIGRLQAYRTWASFYVCRVGVEAAEWLEMEKELRELWGVSTLAAHGLIVRCAAKRGRDVLPGFHAVWSATKWRLYGRAAVMPRKVN